MTHDYPLCSIALRTGLVFQCRVLLGFFSVPFRKCISCQGAIGAAVRNLESLGNRDLTMPPKKEPTKHQTFSCWMLGEGFWANITGEPHDVGENCRDWNFNKGIQTTKKGYPKVRQGKSMVRWWFRLASDPSNQGFPIGLTTNLQFFEASH